MLGLKRAENVLNYLIDLNKKQPIEKMSHGEMLQLLNAVGWKKGEDYEQARRKLLRLLVFLSRNDDLSNKLR